MTFAPMAPAEAWWPQELGQPSATGAQNDLRYAVFPTARRLAVERQGRLSVHEIGELHITGCSQASGGGEVQFTTGTGTVSLVSLPEVAAPTSQQAPAAATAPGPAPEHQQSEVLDALAKLGALKEQGILTVEEFAAKKAELLRRL